MTSTAIVIIIVAALVLATAVVLYRMWAEYTLKLRTLESKKGTQGVVMPLRLQAYERMGLFLERIEPNQLVMRIHSGGLTVAEEQNLLLTAIRSEYEHNLSQQIYISNPVWNKISDAKDDIIDIINAVAATFPPDSESFPFAEALLTAAAEKPVVQQAMTVLKADVQTLF
ncbi:MAG: hypothetical protein II751_01815 [Bacteroidales bacterium]|jgi:hypothetical protein|nr:hypothetical protein [Bacteroidales bacterium]